MAQERLETKPRKYIAGICTLQLLLLFAPCLGLIVYIFVSGKGFRYCEDHGSKFGNTPATCRRAEQDDRRGCDECVCVKNDGTSFCDPEDPQLIVFALIILFSIAFCSLLCWLYGLRLLCDCKEPDMGRDLPEFRRQQQQGTRQRHTDPAFPCCFSL